MDKVKKWTLDEKWKLLIMRKLCSNFAKGCCFVISFYQAVIASMIAMYNIAILILL